MNGVFRKLSDAGISVFTGYIRGGAEGPPPFSLISKPETSAPLLNEIEPDNSGVFEDRFSFGVYLNTLLKEFDPATISGDAGLWNALALYWFDRICPPDKQGVRNLGKEYRYLLSADYRNYYRHLVRSPWQLVRDHGEAARFLLVSPRKQSHPLSVGGDIMEQIAGRQQVLRSTPIIRAASKLYFDNDSGRPRTGVAGNGRGSARRFGLVLRQLDLTYDPACMSDDEFINILPDEFNKWKKLLGNEPLCVT